MTPMYDRTLLLLSFSHSHDISQKFYKISSLKRLNLTFFSKNFCLTRKPCQTVNKELNEIDKKRRKINKNQQKVYFQT